jgi:hypothetical protein
LILASPANADICGRALALRVNQQGLAFVAEQVKSLIPTRIDLPDLSAVVVDWPGTDDDATVNVKALGIELAVNDLQLYINGSTLNVSINVDVRTSGPVEILNPYGSFGSAQCSADINLNDLHLMLGATIDTVGDQIRVSVTSLVLTLNNQDTKIALEGCALGSILTAVVDLLRNHFMGSVNAKLEQLATTHVPQLVASKLDESVGYAGETESVGYLVQLEELQSDQTGLEAVVGADVYFKSSTSSSPCAANLPQSEPPPCYGSKPQLEPDYQAMFAAGVSQDLLNRLLHSIWRSGRLCLDSRTLDKPELSAQLAALPAALAQPAGTEVAFQLHVHTAPKLNITRNGGATLLLSDVRFDLQLLPPDAKAGAISLEATLSVSVLPTIDPQSNTITVILQEAGIKKLKLIGENGPTLDPARLERYLTKIVLPVLQRKLDTAQLSPAVIGFKEYWVYIKRIALGDGSLAAYLDVLDGKRVQTDSTPPSTSLVRNPGALVGPELLQVFVSGVDDQTPAPLLRYRYQIDGGPWSDPSHASRIDLVTSAGTHTLAVAAIDLAGNVDPNPMVLNFTVDDVPPALEILERPDSLSAGGDLVVRFAGSDDRTAPGELRYTAQLLAVPEGGGYPEVVAAADVAPGADRVAFKDVGDGTYKIRVTVSDRAGNVSSKDVSFVVHNRGCSTATGPLSPLTVLLVLVFLAIVRRCRN